MISQKRYLKSFAGEKPNWVPETLFVLDQGHFLNQNYPNEDHWDFVVLHLEVIELHKLINADVFVRMHFGINDPFWIHFGDLDVSQQSKLDSETRRVSKWKYVDPSFHNFFSW
jgi:hypothetical protein